MINERIHYEFEGEYCDTLTFYTDEDGDVHIDDRDGQTYILSPADAYELGSLLLELAGAGECEHCSEPAEVIEGPPALPFIDEAASYPEDLLRRLLSR